MYNACQAAIELMEAYSQTLAKMNEVKMNDRVKMRRKPLARSEDQRTDKSWCKQEKNFEYRVKLMRGQGKLRS